MLKITQIKIPVADKKQDIESKICSILKVDSKRILKWDIVRKSVEARKNETLSFVYSVEVHLRNEAQILKKNRKNVLPAEEVNYIIPIHGEKVLNNRPVIIGSGPAGLFCAYILAQKGFSPIVLERGEKIEDRKKSVEKFWTSGILNTESNVQFGEGGAGTFSDGKLNTGVNDKEGRIKYVLKTFVENGAPKDILYDAKPHVGTDILYDVDRNIRNEIIKLGGEFRFSSKADDVLIENGSLKGIILEDKNVIPSEVCVAAIGHSARDTVKMFHRKGIIMQPKPFAVGIRIQHPQEMINISQWGKDYPKKLGAAPYRLSVKTGDNRGVYTFCMCPGGYVVNASSENTMTAVNGMSYSGRNSGFANSAVIVTVSPDDYLKYSDNDTPYELSAVAFQRMLEKKAFDIAKGAIPVQRFEDFEKGKKSLSNSFAPCTKGSWEYERTDSIFPEFISKDIIGGIKQMGMKIRDFDMPDALLMGVESRTSSPVKILRNEKYQSNIEGIYPCGEGAGYAGGIVSAAVDGIKTAESIIKEYKPLIL